MDLQITFRWILGNHDIYWRESTDVSSASELYHYFHDYISIRRALFNHKNLSFKVYDKTTEYFLDNDQKYVNATKILFVPWICKSNREHTLEMINKSDAQICLGHLELQGFEMYKGSKIDHGEDPKLFEKFDLTCTGHYHHKSSNNKIHYLGATGQHNWHDFDDPRGFHILDTDDLSLHFIPNPFELFQKVFYDDAGDRNIQIDFGGLKGKFIKVIVRSRTDSDQYNTFMTNIEMAQPLEIQVVDDHFNLNKIDDKAIVSETQDTLTIIREFVSQTNNTINASKLDNLIVELYHDAQAVQ
jgi:hypothetical protein